MSELFPTFLRYPGGKSKPKVRELIRSYFPESFKEYREPFLGGAGLFFSVDSNMRRWINDLNRPLIAVYEALKSRPKEFIKQCRAISPATKDEPLITARSGQQYPKRLWDLYYEFLDDQDMDPALRYLFLNRTSRFGRVILDPHRRSRNDFTNPQGWSHGLFERLALAANHLSDATTTCSDFIWLFEEPGDDVLIYADPPYMRQSDTLYEQAFSMDDHRRLRDVVKGCKHKVCLSYDDHPVIRELYGDFCYIHEGQWPYIGRRDQKIGRELLITNYPVVEMDMVTVEKTPVVNLPSSPAIPLDLAA